MWWCEECGKLEEIDVNYMEQCTVCGNDVEWRKEVLNEKLGDD